MEPTLNEKAASVIRTLADQNEILLDLSTAASSSADHEAEQALNLAQGEIEMAIAILKKRFHHV